MILDGILYFAENMGQSKSGCSYILEQSAYKVLFYQDRVEFILYGEEEDDHIILSLVLRNTDTYQEQDEMFLEARDKMNITINYMDGEKNEWIKNVPAYERICYHDLCDGIDMEFFIEDGQLKQNFIVFSDENLDDLKLCFQGQDDIYFESDNEIVIVGKQDTFVLDTPYNYFDQKLNRLNEFKS